MTTSDNMPKTIHEGRNVKRIREILGIKQEALAADLGDEWTQKKISLLESKEAIEPELLQHVANALGVPVEAIKNFDENAAINYINTFNDNSINHGHFSPEFNQCTFNPIEKIVQLYDEKIALYERMIKEKNNTIEKLSKSKKK